jgi:septum formation protein
MLHLSLPLVLASNSPRRQQLLRDAGFEFRVEVRPTTEEFPDTMPAQEVPAFLALQKAECFLEEAQHSLILTADTIVVVDDQILNKPQDFAEAKQMLQLLSGRQHQVMTGVCLKTPTHTHTLVDIATVTFKELSAQEIEYYIKTCRPFDKAGAYGVQDFIGMVGIPRIEGSYFTVMGLPVHRVYELLREYIQL